MSERFFQKGSYLLRLDNIRPIEAKPAKRIHLNMSMLLTEEAIPNAPTRIKRVWEIVSNPNLDCFRVPISSQLKGIDIEVFPCEPIAGTPVIVTISNCILRDIHVDREKRDEKLWDTRLNFSVGINWNGDVWEWGADYVFMECYAKFSESQGAMFDDHEADAVIASPEAERLRNAQVEDLAGQLGTNPPAVTESPRTDPLAHELTPKRGKGKVRAFESGKRKRGYTRKETPAGDRPGV